MLYRGIKPKEISQSTTLARRRENRKTKLVRFEKRRMRRLAFHHLYFYIPPTWKFLLYYNKSLGRNVLYMYSGVYYINLTLPQLETFVYAGSGARVLYFNTLFASEGVRIYLNEVYRITAMFYRPIFRKIKFKGKGYYIYKNIRNTITPQFGYSHRLYTYAYFTTVRFLSKTSIFVFGFLKSDVAVVSISIKWMRPINIFTGRGVRFAKQIIYKKAGKISSYR